MRKRTLAHYEIGPKIGQGGMGEVYRARDTKLDRDVALKILPPELMADPGSNERFQREAKALAALNHPNIVTVHSVESDGAVQFLTMELLSGQTLQGSIGPGGIELEQFFDIAISLADALHAAHAAGVVHRDLKPQNIMRAGSGAVKILDFGLAKQIRADESAGTVADLTSAGQILGTVDYMSPEHVRGHALDERSDLFSLGVIFHELLTGQHAFRRSSAPETQSAVLSEPASDVHVANPRIPESVSRVVRRCLEKDPQRRIQSALELRNALQDLRRELSAKPSRSPLGWLLPTAVVIAAAAFWFLSRDVQPPPAEPEAPDGPIRVAILPFANQGSPDDAFFVEGMREEIASKLGGIEGLGVVSQTNATGLHVGDRSIQELGEEFASEYILTASIYTDRSQTDAQKVRVTPRVVRVQDNLQLWSESFSADLLPGEIFEIQAQIAERVAASIDEGLVSRVAREEPTLDAGAYENYLLGRYHWNRRTGESLQKAAQYFERAIEQDPEFVRAYAGLADAVALYPFYSVPPELQAGAAAKAEEMARRALELDPELGEAHASLAFARMYGAWDWEGAEASFRRAIELAPDYPVAHYWYCELLTCEGRYQEALEQVRIAVDLEPALPIAHHLLGVVASLNGLFDEAERAARRALELEPEFRLPHYALATMNLMQENYEGWAAEMVGLGVPRDAAQIVVDFQAGRLSTEEASRRQDEFAAALDPPPSPMARCLMRVLVEDIGGAMDFLAQAEAARIPEVLLLSAWADGAPAYAKLRSDPRFAAFEARVGARRPRAD